MSLLPPDNPFELKPDASRTEPVVWVRRLVILESEKAFDSPVRDIAFRRGLNLIRTAEHPPGETRPVGHSVGKTLLTRLIRYCLGESHFATEPVRKRIAAKLPEGLVFAEIRVAGVDWVVRRPLRDAATSQSRASSIAASWLALIEESKEHVPYADFLKAINEATTADIPSIDLPKAGHPVGWRDLLGWLARDHECRYRVYKEWRDPDAESGTGRLDRNDASFLLRLAMGLVNSDELELIAEHRQLSARLEANRREQIRSQRLAEGLHIHLQQRLDLDDDDLPEDQAQAGGLFLTRAEDAAAAKTGQLNRLLEEIEEETTLGSLSDRLIETSNVLAVAKADQERIEGLREQAESQLKSIEQANDETFYEHFVDQMECPSEACPLKPKNRPADEPDPRRESQLTELRTAIQRHDEELVALETQITELRSSAATARRDCDAERRRLIQSRSGIARQIGSWESTVEQAKDYANAIESLGSAELSEGEIKKARQASYDRLEASRGRHRSQLRQISECYDWVVQELIGEAAGGKVSLDAWGLHPEPDESVAANGAAMATLATVIGFDLACLVASIQGLGHHPRIVIHDSPKEADMEPSLYDRVFLLAEQLEAVFGSSEPSFQYIVTTTSQPPDRFCHEPITKLVLDGREADGSLLKVRF
ncbi:MAG: hypothetical protein AAGF31_01455 [Planctomycetota bacterium]